MEVPGVEAAKVKVAGVEVVEVETPCLVIDLGKMM